MVDKALLLRKLAELDEYLEQIKEYANISLKEYSEDWKVQRIIERTLQMMIETCTDITNHIISDRGYRIPEGYADAFKVLHEENILSKELFEAMREMVKFRNIVVHQYDRVDRVIVVNILRKHLTDFLLFKEAVMAALQ